MDVEKLVGSQNRGPNGGNVVEGAASRWQERKEEDELDAQGSEAAGRDELEVASSAGWEKLGSGPAEEIDGGLTRI